jgi:hypothetical protein
MSPIGPACFQADPLMTLEADIESLPLVTKEPTPVPGLSANRKLSRNALLGNVWNMLHIWSHKLP